ncbi:MAG: HEPN domain-containing protein [Acidobacteriaceae bacterium]
MTNPQTDLLLRSSSSDETVLRLDVSDGVFGFHAQQSVEKLLKALISEHNIRQKRTHSIEELLNQLATMGERMPELPILLPSLTVFAVEFYYFEVPEFSEIDRASIIDSVRILREHIIARIAALRD